jgi:hypothetical protein
MINSELDFESAKIAHPNQQLNPQPQGVTFFGQIHFRWSADGLTITSSSLLALTKRKCSPTQQLNCLLVGQSDRPEVSQVNDGGGQMSGWNEIRDENMQTGFYWELLGWETFGFGIGRPKSDEQIKIVVVVFDWRRNVKNESEKWAGIYWWKRREWENG